MQLMDRDQVSSLHNTTMILLRIFLISYEFYLCPEMDSSAVTFNMYDIEL